MFGSGMLDVLIGLILIFLLLSTVCSALVELTASALFKNSATSSFPAIGGKLITPPCDRNA